MTDSEKIEEWCECENPEGNIWECGKCGKWILRNDEYCKCKPPNPLTNEHSICKDCNKYIEPINSQPRVEFPSEIKIAHWERGSKEVICAEKINKIIKYLKVRFA